MVRIGQGTRQYHREGSPNQVFPIFYAFISTRMIYKATHMFIWTLCNWKIKIDPKLAPNPSLTDVSKS